MITKEKYETIREAQRHPSNVARLAAIRAANHVAPALVAAHTGDIEDTRDHAQRAHDAARTAEEALIVARDRAYNAAISIGFNQPHAHSLTIHATSDAHQYAKDARDAARQARRALTLANIVAENHSALCN